MFEPSWPRRGSESQKVQLAFNLCDNHEPQIPRPKGCVPSQRCPQGRAGAVPACWSFQIMSFLDPFKGIANCCYYLLKHKLGAVCKGGNHKNCRPVKRGSKQLPEGRPRGGISSPQDGWDFLLPLDGAISRGCAYPIHGCGRTKHGRSWQQPAMMTAGELVPKPINSNPRSL